MDGSVALSASALPLSSVGFRATLPSSEMLVLATPHGATVTFCAPVFAFRPPPATAAAEEAAGAATGGKKPQFTPEHPVALMAAALSSTAEMAAVGDADGHVHLVLTAESDGAPIRRTLSGHVGEISACAFFPSDQVLLTVGTLMLEG